MINRHPLDRWIFERYPSVGAFAHEAGISQSMLSMVLNGKRQPSMATITRITDATGGGITANDFQEYARSLQGGKT